MANLTTMANVQINFLADVNDEVKNQALDHVFDQIRRKYGTQQIMLGETADSYQKLEEISAKYDLLLKQIKEKENIIKDKELQENNKI